MFPASTSRPIQPFGGSWLRNCTHATVRGSSFLAPTAYHLFENTSACWLRFAKTVRKQRCARSSVIES